jgi:O-antigen/teichoic acid export membrane protein
MSGARRLGAASLWMFVSTMVLNFAMVLYNRSMSIRLGDAGYGQLSALSALGNVLSVLNIGAGTWLVKVFATDDAQGGPGAAKTRLRGLALPFLGAVLGLALALLPFAGWISGYLHTPVRVYNWVLAGFVGGMLATLLRSAVQGMHRFGWLGSSLAGDGVSRVAFATALVGRGWGVDGALASQVLAQSVGSALAGLGVSRGPRQGHTASTQRLRAVDMALDTAALGLFSVLCFIDVLVMKHHLDDAGAGLYSRAALVAKSFLYLAAALNIVLLPAVAAARAAGHDPRPILAKFLGAALILDLVGLAGLWLLTGWSIRLLCGPDPALQALIPLVRDLAMAVIPVGLFQLVLFYHLALGSRLPLLLMALGVPILWFLLERAGGDMAQVPACLGSIAFALLVACTWAAWTPKKKTP